ncbi:MAG: hypothetical protein JWM78_3491 [Verrucomicrobiaceae bacterium]|nr:hypothetical protein [Verrucomicrobiaceae bacterium]
MKQKKANLLAILTAPIIPLLIGAILTPETGQFDFMTILVFALIFYLISVLITVFLGAPLFFFFLRHNLVKWWSGPMVGFSIGSAIAIFLRLPSLASFREIFFLGLEGGCSAFVFWLIWRQGDDPLNSEE